MYSQGSDARRLQQQTGLFPCCLRRPLQDQGVAAQRPLDPCGDGNSGRVSWLLPVPPSVRPHHAGWCRCVSETSNPESCRRNRLGNHAQKESVHRQETNSLTIRTRTQAQDSSTSPNVRRSTTAHRRTWRAGFTQDNKRVAVARRNSLNL
jgi:hypothetical protein